MMKTVLSTAALLAAANAFTQPVQPPTYGSLLTPNTGSSVTTGQTYTVTWSPHQPADGVTVSLVLCNGPPSNCVLQSSAIVEGVPAAAASYSWNVPCSLPAGTQNTASGYGMLIIVDGTGEFQYSTQFSVQKGDSCSATTSSSSSSSSSSTSSSSKSSSSSSSAPAHTDSASTWLNWSSSQSSTATYSFTTVTSSPQAYTMTSSMASPVGPTTHAKSSSAMSSMYAPSTVVISATSAAASGSMTSTRPSASLFTGAAARPTGFVNVAAGVIGAAGLAVFAL